MFSDLVGSTALSARMDPEDLARSFRPIRNALPRRCSASAGSWRNIWATACSSISAIRRLTRMIAERAVRAGLALIEAVGKLEVR